MDTISPICMYLHHVCVWRLWRSEEGALDPREPELWVVVSSHVDAGNQIPTSCGSNKGCNHWAISPAPRRRALLWLLV